jgi:hypothetical protein
VDLSAALVMLAGMESRAGHTYAARAALHEAEALGVADHADRLRAVRSSL